MSNQTVSPESIMRIASGFMAAKHLFAASQLGLFEALAESPATLEALAARIGLTSRAARISADAMVALGLLERHGDSYRNGETAATFLAGRTPADLRPFLRFWDRVSYPAWAELAQTLGKGPSKQVFDLDPALQEVVSAGIEAILVGPANALAASDALKQHRRLLDVGGGTGSWTIAAARRHPDLRATVFELPIVAEVARKRIADAGLTARIDVQAGDVLKDALPGGHDVFLLANIIHYWSPAGNRALLKSVRASAERGALLLLADFWTNATHTEPLMAALMAGEFAAHVKDGDVYSLDEVRQWLPETGWRFQDHRPLAGPVSVVVAEAT
jgi:SAM-dependent methyltransferase